MHALRHFGIIFIGLEIHSELNILLDILQAMLKLPLLYTETNIRGTPWCTHDDILGPFSEARFLKLMDGSEP